MKMYNNLRSTVLIPVDQFFNSIEDREAFFATESGSKRLDPTSPAYTPFCVIKTDQADSNTTAAGVMYEWLPKDDKHHWVAVSCATEGVPGKPGKDGLSSIQFGTVTMIPWYEQPKAHTYGTTDNVMVDLYIPSGKPGLAPEDIDIMSSNGSFHIRKSVRGDNLTFDITKDENAFADERSELEDLKNRVKELENIVNSLTGHTILLSSSDSYSQNTETLSNTTQKITYLSRDN